MTEPTFTLEEARKELARQACETQGHSFQIVAPVDEGAKDPLAVYCGRCSQRWQCTSPLTPEERQSLVDAADTLDASHIMNVTADLEIYLKAIEKLRASF